jgi:hypothetical protein
LIFRHGNVNFELLIKLIKCGLLQKVKNWEFYKTNICSKTISHIFSNKYTPDAEGLIIEFDRDNKGLISSLFGIKKLHNLKKLGFINANIQKEVLKELVHHPLMQNIEILDLSKNFLVDEIVENCLKNLNAPKLAHLDLHKCNLSAKSVG